MASVTQRQMHRQTAPNSRGDNRELDSYGSAQHAESSPEDSSLPQTVACESEGASFWVSLPPLPPRGGDWAVGHTEGNREWELGGRKCGFVRSGSCPSVLADRKALLVVLCPLYACLGYEAQELSTLHSQGWDCVASARTEP